MFGRGIVVGPGGACEEAWERIVVDGRDLEETVPRLQAAWGERRPVTVELHLSKQALKEPERCSLAPYELDPAFELWRERLHFLVWANNLDATGTGEPIWWLDRLAKRLGSDAPTDGGPRGTLAIPVLHRESIEMGSTGLTLGPIQPSEDLASDQLEAVRLPGGAARILAPAGSGKTRVLTARLRYLLSRGYEPERITALAYNRRAALEMQQRLPGCRARICTLHALGYGLLRRAGKVDVARDSQVRGLLKRIWKAVPLVNQDPYQPYLEALQQIRLGLCDPAEVEKSRDDVPGLARGFPLYREALAEAGLVDHDEQIYGAIELLLAHPEARKAARRACTHLLVDEFQDLTPAFLLLIRLLAAPAYQVFGVGDDDQVIYGYAGADPAFLLDYRSYFPGAAERQLEVNYRCPRLVVESAATLLSRNRRRVAKSVRPGPSCGEAPPKLRLCAAEGWASAAVEEVQLWLQTYGPSQVAVLARVNSILMPVQVALGLAGLPHGSVVQEKVLERTGLRTALAYWRLARQDWRCADLADTLRRPSRMLRREILAQACECTSERELRRFAQRQEAWPGQSLEDYLAMLDRLKRTVPRGPEVFFRSLRQDRDFVEALDQLDAAGLGAAGASHLDDIRSLEQTARLCPSPDRFEDWLRDQLAGPGSEEGIRLSSIHRVKGLEWECVLLYGVDDGLIPHRLSADREEERRVFHVGLTRCREQLTMLGDTPTLSPFVTELAPPPGGGAKKKKKRKKR